MGRYRVGYGGRFLGRVDGSGCGALIARDWTTGIAAAYRQLKDKEKPDSLVKLPVAGQARYFFVHGVARKITGLPTTHVELDVDAQVVI